jgi:PAS domain S-box-containing protein
MVNIDMPYKKELVQIQRLLKAHPRGLTITDIAKEMNINRNSVARYMDVLTVSGQVEMRALGPAKVFYLSQRVPISAMLNFSSDHIMALDKDLKIIQISDNFSKILNIQREAILGLDIEDFPNPVFTSQEMHSRVKEAFDGKEVTFETKFQVDEREIYFDIKLLPTTFDDGSIGLTWILHDITERKQIEEKLRESEERFRSLTESTSDWIWEVDQNNIYTYVSPKVKELLGYEQEEVIGKTPFDLMPPDEAKRVASIFRSIAQSRTPLVRLENTNLHKDDHLVVLETSGVPIFDAHEHFRGYRGIDRNITERKSMEKELTEANQALRERVKELTFVQAAIREMQKAKSTEDLVPQLIDLLMQAMQFPEITAPVVKIEGKRFAHKRYRGDLTHSIHAEICIADQTIGRVSVYYTKDRPFIIPHEQNMLNALAESLGGWVKGKQIAS